MNSSDALTLGEVLYVLVILCLLVFFGFLHASMQTAGTKSTNQTKAHFIIVLGHFIGFFYRQTKKNVLNSLESLKSYLGTAYGDDVAERTAESLVFQQGRIVRRDFSTKYIKGLPHKLRLQILIILFKIAKHEKLCDKPTLNILQDISNALFIRQQIFDRTKRVQFPNYEEPDEQSQQTQSYSFAQSELALINARNLLKVSKNTGDKELKQSFRSLAKKYHPDVNPDASSEKFQEIKAAYELIKQHRGLT